MDFISLIKYLNNGKMHPQYTGTNEAKYHLFFRLRLEFKFKILLLVK